MDKQQYDAAIATLNNSELSNQEKVTEVSKVLGVDITDEAAAETLKIVTVGNGTIKIKENADETITVAFDGIEVTGTSFGIAFIATLMNVIADRALDKFLPQAKPAPATGSRTGGLASPAGNRQLPRPRGGF